MLSYPVWKSRGQLNKITILTTPHSLTHFYLNAIPGPQDRFKNDTTPRLIQSGGWLHDVCNWLNTPSPASSPKPSRGESVALVSITFTIDHPCSCIWMRTSLFSSSTHELYLLALRNSRIDTPLNTFEHLWLLLFIISHRKSFKTRCTWIAG